MEPLRPIFWGQGMFLQPQHFQQQDAYHDARLSHFFRLFVSSCWGVKSLAVNEPRLKNFIFEIESCEVLTWDGTLLRFRGDARPSNARVEPRSFEADLDPSGKPLSVYLGLRKLQLEETNLKEPAPPGGPGGAKSAEGSHRRFVLEESEVADLGAGSEQTSRLQLLVHEGHLLFDVPASRSQDYEMVKIAEVVRSPDGGGGSLSRTYIPPCVALDSSPVLERMVKEIRDLVTAKAQELTQYRKRLGKERVELGSRDIGFFLILYTMNRYVPLLHHYLEAKDIHPFVAYGLLRQLVGELATFSETVSPLGAREGGDPLPPYRHDALHPCFDTAVHRAAELLAEITTGPVGDVLLVHDGEYFSASLEEPFFAGDNRYYLAIKSDLSPPQIARLLQDTGKITAREDMPKLQKSFLFGLKIEVLESPPEELLMRAHYRYFLIDQRSDHWLKIQKLRNIAVNCAALPPETEIRLLVIYGR